METRTSITLNLNSAAFSGTDLGDMDPEWEMIDKYDYKGEREFRSSAEGPGSWFIHIVLSGTLTMSAIFAKAYLDELGKDLYKWSKEKLQPVFSKSQKGDGSVRLKFNDKEIIIYGANPYDEHFEDLWLEIPQLFEMLKNRTEKNKFSYFARWNSDSEKWIIKENNY